MSLTRRTVLGTAMLGGLAAGQADAQAPATIRLRLLETSDLHMFAYDYDYYAGRQDNTVGLAKVATLIGKARAEARNSLLFDNGDILQGNPLGDYVALQEPIPSTDRVHPMFRAMNRLGYDAATLGNHEFNYGLPFLDASLAGARFPFVCANLKHVDGRDYLPPFIVLDRELVDESGQSHGVRIGVIGLVTPQIMTWDQAHLAGKVAALDIVDTARRYVPVLRPRVDLLLVLSHSGISGAPRAGGDENASLYLSQIPGIDAIFTGHEHKLFPGPFFADQGPAVDTVRGTLGGVPAVMPGFWGSHLGLIDLVLQARPGGGWRVADFHVEARPIYERHGAQVLSLAADDPRILDAVAPDHQQTLRWMEQPVGRTETPITSYFALVGTDSSIGIVNAAQLWYARPLLAATANGHLPVLSATAPFKAGGTGPTAFVDIAPGPLTMKDVANLYMFANTVCAVRCTGLELREWLEKSASLFNRIDPADPSPQGVIGERIPSFNFDVIAGVTYRIDVSQPARYDAGGHVLDQAAHRIVDLRFEDRPVSPTQAFLVVTNNYRASGGGGFPGTGPDHLVWQAPDFNRDVVTRFIRQQGTLHPQTAPVWSFAAVGRPVSLRFSAAAAAQRLLGDHPNIRPLGPQPDGGFGYALGVPA